MMMRLQYIAVLLLLIGLNGCAGMVTGSLMRPTVENLQRQTDVDLVCEGTPAFLLMLDSMVASAPEDKNLLLTATQAYTGYVAAMESCDKPERAATLSVKAKSYGISLLWGTADLKSICTMSQPDLQQKLAELDSNDAEALFWAASGWATWIRFQEGSPQSMAQLVHVEQLMLRLLELDENYYHGGAHLFMGAYYGTKPPLLGGNPELSRSHFERALVLGSRQYLPTLVLYARTYARMTLDRELFVSLLQEVLDFPLGSQPDSALANQVAKRNAARLLAQVDQFF
ncbi:MAG: TRAP transporter TatT component family protein [Thermodesulfobacteriota bacterium]